jgi:hypothetical protein
MRDFIVPDGMCDCWGTTNYAPPGELDELEDSEEPDELEKLWERFMAQHEVERSTQESMYNRPCDQHFAYRPSFTQVYTET